MWNSERCDKSYGRLTGLMGGKLHDGVQRRLFRSSIAGLISALLIIYIVWGKSLSYGNGSQEQFFSTGHGIFILLSVITSFWVLDMPRYGRIVMLTPVLYAALLLYGPLWCQLLITISGAAKFLSCRALKRKVPKEEERELFFLFICFGTGGLIYRALIDRPFSKLLDVHTVLVLILTALIILLLNHILTFIERKINTGINLRYLLKINLGNIKVHLAMLVPVGLLVATVYLIDPKALLLLAPVYLMYASIKNYSEISREARAAIEDLALAYESRDPFSRSHSLNVAQIAGEIAREMFLEEEEIEKIISAGKLHDIGKIGIADEILEKGKLEQLSFEEYEEIRKHPETGFKVAYQLKWYEDEAKLIYSHHEWFDGSGYPEGKRGEEILIGSRILAVAEAFDSMASPRSYRDPIPLPVILDELRKKRGTQFDPQVVDAFLAIVKRQGQAAVPQ
ncbi:MAG: HD domain-containing protein [Candidatus Eremiobacteraeota bacterium]|nr:HD domain-containing protein [Candidatus Eremiobacteraeota bacterium]